MSQNRGRDDRAGVVSALAEQPSESARATATVMRELMQAEDEA